MKSLLTSLLALAIATAPLELSAATPSKNLHNPHNIIQRVLLVSVDGMHSLDFVNCAKGVPRRERRRSVLSKSGCTGRNRHHLSECFHLEAVGLLSGLDGAGERWLSPQRRRFL